MKGKLVPGSILVRNTVKRAKKNSAVLYNKDKKISIPCKCDFSDMKKIDEYTFKHNFCDLFGLCKKNKNIFYPVVIGKDASEAYLLAPSMIDYLSPGMVVADLMFRRDYGRVGQKPLFLAYSQSFNDDKEIIQEGNITYPFKYEVMVHSDQAINLNLPCQALVYQLSHYKTQRGGFQHFKHVDANLLFYYESEDLYKENLKSLEYILDHEEEMWWDLAGNLPKDSFDKITKKVKYLTETEKRELERNPNRPHNPSI